MEIPKTSFNSCAWNSVWTALVYFSFKKRKYSPFNILKREFRRKLWSRVWWAQFLCTVDGNFESTILFYFKSYMYITRFLIHVNFQETLMLLQKFASCAWSRTPCIVHWIRLIVGIWGDKGPPLTVIANTTDFCSCTNCTAL
jgi:hypothetical protein